MQAQPDKDVWAAGNLYEPYVGRWSRLVAREFLDWLAVPAQGHWLDVGCGTGALSAAVVAHSAPASVTGVDPSAAFIEYARAHAQGPVRFLVGDAQALPIESASMDASVCGLVINFVPRPQPPAQEMARATRSGGIVAAYVWDYAGRMELMRYFWDAAVEVDPAARALDEGTRFPLCEPAALEELFTGAGLLRVDGRAIEVPTKFRDFDDYWSPFLGGQGPAPAYAMSLDEPRRAALRELIRSRLPQAADGSISLVARAWAVRGQRA